MLRAFLAKHKAANHVVVTLYKTRPVRYGFVSSELISTPNSDGAETLPPPPSLSQNFDDEFEFETNVPMGRAFLSQLSGSFNGFSQSHWAAGVFNLAAAVRGCEIDGTSSLENLLRGGSSTFLAGHVVLEVYDASDSDVPVDTYIGAGLANHKATLADQIPVLRERASRGGFLFEKGGWERANTYATTMPSQVRVSWMTMDDDG